MSNDDNGDDHLIFGPDHDDERPARHSHADQDGDPEPSEPGPPVFDAQPPVYDTRPAPAEPPAYAQQPPPYAEPPAQDTAPGYDAQSAWSPPPGYAAPPALPAQPVWHEPSGYGDQQQQWGGSPSGYAEPQAGYGEPQAGYGQPQAGYGEAAAGYGEPQPGYGEPTAGYGEQPSGQGELAARYSEPTTDDTGSRSWNEPVGQGGDESYPQAPPAPDPQHYVQEVHEYTEHRAWVAPDQAGRPDPDQTVRRGDLPTFEQRLGMAPQGLPENAVPPPAQSPAVPPPHPPASPAPQQGQPLPRPEDLLIQTRSDVSAAPASWGWRGKVNRATGGLLKPKAAPAEIAARQAIVRIQRSFSRPMTVVVVQPKGGAGKTPTTICLSAAFGAHRGGYVVGWDDNETRGTLAVRVTNPDNQQATVWDLLSDLPAFERYDARVGDLSFYVRAQPDAHFDALVSDDNPGNMAQIGDEEFQRLHQVLQRFYRMIVVDTGNNVRSPNWQAAVNTADLVVVVSTYQRDVGFSASWVLDHLAQTGREELARNAVTVLTAADPASDKQVRAELQEHFARRTRAVVEIPYDPELAHGGPINWMKLAPATRNAWVEAGATVADALAEQEQRVLQARRA